MTTKPIQTGSPNSICTSVDEPDVNTRNTETLKELADHQSYLTEDEEMEHFDHTIIVNVNSAGFSEEDLEALKLDHQNTSVKRTVQYIREWQPCCEGPDSFSLSVIIHAAVGIVGATWLKALADDMYKWTKSQLRESFKRRRRGDGYVKIQFKDKTIYIDHHPSTAEFEDSWLELPQQLDKIKKSPYKYLILVKESNGTWVLEKESNER